MLSVNSEVLVDLGVEGHLWEEPSSLGQSSMIG